MQALPDVEQAGPTPASLTRLPQREAMRVSWWVSGVAIRPAAGYHCIAGAVRETLPPHMVPVVLLQLPQLRLAPTASWIAKPYRCLN